MLAWLVFTLPALASLLVEVAIVKGKKSDNTTTVNLFEPPVFPSFSVICGKPWLLCN